MGFPSGSVGKESACNAGDPGWFLGWENPLEKEMATHFSVLAWRIPWTEEPGGPQSMGSQRVGHDCVTNFYFLTHSMHFWDRMAQGVSSPAIKQLAWILVCWAVISPRFEERKNVSLRWNHFEERQSESESEVTPSCLTLCDPTDCSLPGFSVRGIFQARVLECGFISFSRGSSRPRDRTWASHIVGRCFFWAREVWRKANSKANT